MVKPARSHMFALLAGLMLGGVAAWVVPGEYSDSERNVPGHPVSLLPSSGENGSAPMTEMGLRPHLRRDDRTGNEIRLAQELQYWSTARLESLLRRIDPEEEPEIVRMAAAQWALRDPDGFLEFARTRDDLDQAVVFAIEAAAGNDPNKLRSLLEALTPPQRRKYCSRQLFSLLIKLDPESALALSQTVPGLDTSEAIQAILKRDPSAIQMLIEQAVDDGFQWQLVTAWLEIDPEAAVAWTASLKGQGGRRRHRDALERLTSQAPAAAARYFDRMDWGERHRLVASFLRKDSEGLETWMESLSDPVFKAAVIRTVEIERAIESFLVDETHLDALSTDLQRAVLAKLLNNPANEGFEQALRLSTKLPPGAALTSAVERYVEAASPANEEQWQATVAILENLPPSAELTDAFTRFMRLWAGRDPQSALAWSQSLEVEGFRRAALAGAMDGWGYAAPADAAAFLETIEDKVARHQAATRLVRRWNQQDVGAAVSWAMEHADGRTIEAAFSNIPRQQAPAAMQAFEDVLASETLSTERSKEFALHAARELAKQDAPGTIAWGQQLPAGPEQNLVLRHAMSAWAQFDARSASGFASGFEEPALKDHVAAGLAEGTASLDAQAAWQWGVSISDANLQGEILSRMAGRMDRGEARAAIEEAPISPVQKTRLLGGLE